MLYLGADHRGFPLKEKLKAFLNEKTIAYEDMGAFSLEPSDDFTGFALRVAQAVSKNPSEHKGILICGSGVGVDVVANKVKGIISGLLLSKEHAKAASYDDAINVAAIPADYVLEDEAKAIITAFLETQPSQEERHLRRVQKIKVIEDPKQG